MKKIWIIIGIAAAVLLCLLGALYLFSGGGRISGDETALYPYTYEQGNGKLKVRITGEFPKGYRWTAETQSDAAEIKEGNQTGKRAIFTLTARAQGGMRVSFILQKPGDLPDRIYEIDCSFFVTDGMTFVIEESSHGELPGLAGGDGRDFSYRVAQESDGELLVRVTHGAAQTWSFEKVGDSVRLNGSSIAAGALLRAEDGSFSELSVTGVKSGAATVYLSNDAGDCIELKFNTGSTGATSLLSYRVMGEDDVRETEDTAFAERYGDVSALIDSVMGDSDGRVQLWLSRDDNLTTFNVGVYEYESPIVTWLLCFSVIAEEADFAGHEAPVKQVTTETASANLYTGDYGVRCVWRVGGKTYLLESANGGPETAEQIAVSLMEALSE